MVPETETTINSTPASTSEVATVCLICFNTAEVSHLKNVDQAPQILSDLFNVLCNYMKWEVPSRYEFSFDEDIFPFCKECRPMLVSLYKSHQRFEELRKDIEGVVLKLSGKILLSIEEKHDARRKDSGSSGQFDCVLGTATLEDVDKVSYYRNVIYRRYCASVRLTLDQGLLSARGKNISLDEDDEVLEENSSESESLGACDLELVASKSDVSSDGENTRQKAKKDLDAVENSKQILTSDEGSEITLLNRPRRSCVDKLKPQELLSEGGEEFVDGFQNDDTDYVPSIASSLSDVEKVASIAGNSSKNGVRHDGLSNIARKDGESDEFGSSDEDVEDADSSDYENVREFPLPQSFTGKLPIPPLYVRRRKIRKKELDTLVFVKAVEMISNANKAVTEAIPPVNVTGYEQEVTTRMYPSEDQEKQTPEEVVIRVESNIFPEFKGRIQKIGDSKYLLDDKISFEFVDNKWRCNSCELFCATKKRLKTHFEICPGDRPADSIEVFRWNDLLTYDVLQDGKFQCRHCKQLASSRADVIVHLRRYHKTKPIVEKKFNCIEVELNKYVCNDKYPFEFGSNKKFKCGTCSETFATKHGVLDHIRTRHVPPAPSRKKVTFQKISADKYTSNGKFCFEKVENEYSCCECIYSSSKLASIKNHILMKHIYPEKFTCDTCGKKYGTKHGLQQHRTTHVADRPIICEACGKAFKSDHQLRLHKDNVHLEDSDKNFTCSDCGKSFRVRALWKSHMHQHKRIVCAICGKLVKNSLLKNHILSHSKVNTFECPKCKKKFRYHNGLSVHLKSHDGVHPYTCDICGMKFTQSYNVTRHKNVAHNPIKIAKASGKSRKRKGEQSSRQAGEGKIQEEQHGKLVKLTTERM